MRRAFTMLELVFVIVIVGILSIAIIPNFQRNTLQEAADQLISHIRYTQHLAMMDNKFDTNDSQWFLERWTIRIKQDLVYAGAYVPNGNFSNKWSYSIYSDTSHDTNPNLSEMAKNPLDNNQYLSGGYNNTLHFENTASMKSLRLGDEYGIKDINFGGGCRSTTMFVHFDYLGRPMNSFPNSNSPYQVSPAGYPRLIIQPCTITLCLSTDCTIATFDEKISIAIERETGYAHIL